MYIIYILIIGARTRIYLYIEKQNKCKLYNVYNACNTEQ